MHTLADELILQAPVRRRYNENHQYGHEIARWGPARVGDDSRDRGGAVLVSSDGVGKWE